MIGFISLLSEDGFCGRCNRMRLTATGATPCLLTDDEIDLMPSLRGGGRRRYTVRNVALAASRTRIINDGNCRDAGGWCKSAAELC
jgi:molybdenum cofactor biosynthesis enzyme MoaA